MNNVFRISFCVLVLGLLAGSPAMAGPLESGVQAYSRADYSGAVKLLTPMAEKGDVDAQYTLGLAHSKLTGTEDHIKAVMWLDIVARTGDADASDERDRIGAGLKPEEFAEGQKRAAEWKAK